MAMKLLLLCFLLLISTKVTVAQDPPPTVAREHLLGPVRLVELFRVTHGRYDGKIVEGNRQIFRKLSFDERGNITEAITYQDGAVLERLVYTYDALRRNTGYDEYYSLSKEQLRGPRKHVYTLNANGKIAEYTVYDTDGTQAARFIYQYDASGNKIEDAFYAWTGKRHSRLVYSYDEAGHNLSQTSYNEDDVIIWKDVSSFDAEGHQMEWMQYQNGILRYKRIFKYGVNGKLAEQETLEFNAPSNLRSSHAPVPGKITYAYNERERSTEISTYDLDGSLKSKEVRTVDEKGNETGIASFAGVDSSRRSLITYEYDSHGNWTKKLWANFPNGAKEAEPYWAEYRTITYY